MSLVPFGVVGLKIRLAALACAALFGLGVLGGHLLDAAVPGARVVFWVLSLLVSLPLFIRVWRSNDEGDVDPRFLHALVPIYLTFPGIFWLIIAGDDGEGPRFGYYPFFGETWTGIGLYFVFLLCVLVYNLLRLNLQRSFRPSRR